MSRGPVDTFDDDPSPDAPLIRGLMLIDDLPDLDDLLHRPAWHADAACREHDPALWFPGTSRPSPAALRVCDRCLVADECQRWANDHAAGLVGVWAGTGYGLRSEPTTPRPRRRSSKRRLSGPRCPDCDRIVGRDGARCQQCAAALRALRRRASTAVEDQAHPSEAA